MKMNDRLGELTGGGGGSSIAPFEIAIDINDDGGGGGGGGGASGSFMEGFFDKVNAVKKDIDAVKKVCYVRTQTYSNLCLMWGLSPPFFGLSRSACCNRIAEIVPARRSPLLLCMYIESTTIRHVQSVVVWRALRERSA